MVEVLERRAREPTGPIEAPRTYPGPGSPANRVLAASRLQSRPSHQRPARLCHFHVFCVLTGDGQALISKRLHADRAEAEGRQPSTDVKLLGSSESRRPLGIDVSARGTNASAVAGNEHAERWNFARNRGGGESARVEKVCRCCCCCCCCCCEENKENKVTRGRDKWCWREVVSARKLEERRAEPRKGSLARSETGERNVAKRRHGRPCGQQSMDEIDGHCPQGEKASRFGLCRCRRFRCSGLCDHRQQRPDAQSVSHAIFTLFLLSSSSLCFFFFSFLLFV